jgi:hypothetical protein
LDVVGTKTGKVLSAQDLMALNGIAIHVWQRSILLGKEYAKVDHMHSYE